MPKPAKLRVFYAAQMKWHETHAIYNIIRHGYLMRLTAELRVCINHKHNRTNSCSDVCAHGSCGVRVPT